MRRRKQVQGRGRGYWTAIVDEFERGDQRQPDFCEGRGIELGTFRQWLYRLRQEGHQPVRSKDHFVPLVVTATDSGVACTFRVGSAELSFAEVPPASYVAELLRLMDR